MTKKDNIWIRLFEPSPGLYPDSVQRQIQTTKNKQTFYVFVVCLFLYPLSIPVTNLSKEIHCIVISLTMTITILYLLLCRSLLWLFHLLFTLYLSFAPFALLSYTKDFFFVYIGHAFSVPPLVFMMSQNTTFTVIAAVLQAIVFQTNYKSEFTHHIEKMGVNIFTEKFIGGITILFIFLVSLYILGLHSLHNKTIELSHTKKVAEDALEQQKTFILSFSHELRNPLNSLLGNLQLALMANLPLEYAEMIQTAQICGELLLQYINNLLDTGKHEVGNLEVTPVFTNVHELFQRAWTISNEIIYRKNLFGHLKIEKQVPAQLQLDSQRMTQILLNLISNAAKFTERGSITTTIQWLPATYISEKCFEPVPYDEDNEGLFEKQENFMNLTSRYLLLTKNKKIFKLDDVIPSQTSSYGILRMIVKDTGCGMKQEALNLLFQKFSQVSEDAGKRKIGSGLGLFITKELCSKMGGEIRVYSREKAGTTFVVCIPTFSLPAGKEHVYSLSRVYKTLKEKNKKAIVVDDSPFNVNLLCSYFKKIGVEVVATANNGEEALSKYIYFREKGTKIDVITLDIEMPKMNGNIVFKKIRQYEENSRKSIVKVVVISGNYGEKQVTHGFDPNIRWKVDYFLKKPLLFEEFMGVIYEILEQTRL